MPAPADASRIKVKCVRRLLIEQLNGNLRFHSRPQKRSCQKNIYKTMHDSGWTVGLKRKPVQRAQRMMQSRSRLERHIGRRTQANEFDHVLGSRKLVGRLATRPDLGSATAAGHLGNALGATGERKFEISREFCWDDSGQPLDLCGTSNLHLNRLDDSNSTGTGTRHSSIEFANASDIRNRIRTEKH